MLYYVPLDLIDSTLVTKLENVEELEETETFGSVLTSLWSLRVKACNSLYCPARGIGAVQQ